MSGGAGGSREPRLADLRRSRIVALVNRSGAVSIGELVTQFEVSPMTIRRDINQLAHEGALVRVHGGAVPTAADGAASRRRGDFVVGMIVPGLDHYWSQIAYSAQAEAGRRGLRFILRASTDYYHDSVSMVRRLVAENRLDGLMLSPPTTPVIRAKVEDWVHHHSPCAVFVERNVVDPRLSRVQSVKSDHARGVAMALQHLFDLGHRRVALMAPPASPSREEVLAGWHAVVQLLDLPVLPVFESVLVTDAEGPQRMRATLEQCRGLGVTATLVVGDPHALTVLHAARELNIAVPDELSVIGFDDDLARLGQPQLTSVRPPRETVGRVAVQLVLDHLRHGDDHPIQHIRINGTLSIRKSTAPPPG